MRFFGRVLLAAVALPFPSARVAAFSAPRPFLSVAPRGQPEGAPLGESVDGEDGRFADIDGSAPGQRRRRSGGDGEAGGWAAGLLGTATASRPRVSEALAAGVVLSSIAGGDAVAADVPSEAIVEATSPAASSEAVPAKIETMPPSAISAISLPGAGSGTEEDAPEAVVAREDSAVIGGEESPFRTEAAGEEELGVEGGAGGPPAAEADDGNAMGFAVTAPAAVDFGGEASGAARSAAEWFASVLGKFSIGDMWSDEEKAASAVALPTTIIAAIVISMSSVLTKDKEKKMNRNEESRDWEDDEWEEDDSIPYGLREEAPNYDNILKSAPASIEPNIKNDNILKSAPPDVSFVKAPNYSSVPVDAAVREENDSPPASSAVDLPPAETPSKDFAWIEGPGFKRTAEEVRGPGFGGAAKEGLPPGVGGATKGTSADGTRRKGSFGPAGMGFATYGLGKGRKGRTPSKGEAVGPRTPASKSASEGTEPKEVLEGESLSKEALEARGARKRSLVNQAVSPKPPTRKSPNKGSAPKEAPPVERIPNDPRSDASTRGKTATGAVRSGAAKTGLPPRPAKGSAAPNVVSLPKSFESTDRGLKSSRGMDATGISMADLMKGGANGDPEPDPRSLVGAESAKRVFDAAASIVLADVAGRSDVGALETGEATTRGAKKAPDVVRLPDSFKGSTKGKSAAGISMANVMKGKASNRPVGAGPGIGARKGGMGGSPPGRKTGLGPSKLSPPAVIKGGVPQKDKGGPSNDAVRIPKEPPKKSSANSDAGGNAGAGAGFVMLGAPEKKSPGLESVPTPSTIGGSAGTNFVAQGAPKKGSGGPKSFAKRSYKKSPTAGRNGAAGAGSGFVPGGGPVGVAPPKWKSPAGSAPSPRGTAKGSDSSRPAFVAGPGGVSSIPPKRGAVVAGDSIGGPPAAAAVGAVNDGARNAMNPGGPPSKRGGTAPPPAKGFAKSFAKASYKGSAGTGGTAGGAFGIPPKQSSGQAKGKATPKSFAKSPSKASAGKSAGTGGGAPGVLGGRSFGEAGIAPGGRFRAPAETGGAATRGARKAPDFVRLPDSFNGPPNGMPAAGISMANVMRQSSGEASVAPGAGPTPPGRDAPPSKGSESQGGTSRKEAGRGGAEAPGGFLSDLSQVGAAPSSMPPAPAGTSKSPPPPEEGGSSVRRSFAPPPRASPVVPTPTAASSRPAAPAAPPGEAAEFPPGTNADGGRSGTGGGTSVGEFGAPPSRRGAGTPVGEFGAFAARGAARGNAGPPAAAGARSRPQGPRGRDPGADGAAEGGYSRDAGVVGSEVDAPGGVVTGPPGRGRAEIPLSVTVTDPRTGKVRTIRISGD